MSPPEPKHLDEVDHTTPKNSSTMHIHTDATDHTLSPLQKTPPSNYKMRVLPSPPISPWLIKQSQAGEEVAHETNGYRKDPVLYEDTDSFSHDPPPLFPNEAAKSTGDLIDRHIAMHMVEFKNKLNKPTPDEYKLALSFVSILSEHAKRDPVGYLKRQHDENEDTYWQTKRICAKPMSREERERKQRRAVPISIAPAPKSGKRAIKPMEQKSSSGPRIKRTPKASPIAKLMNYPVKGRSSETPDRMPGTKREDVDYASLPDYAPPLSTLPNNPKVLKADWPSNNILNLANDPDRHMLHEAEVHLAATLRLTCATYLCSKRRIFEARLNALRIGKEFRKTDAQQACKIDVNKASKLWTAYDKVGWFNPDFFRHFLET